MKYDIRKRSIPKMIRSEDEEQMTVIEYCAVRRLPVVHIPNEGRRDPRTGARLKAMGMSAGFPDLFFPAPRSGYHGLMIEMKAGYNKPTEKQLDWLSMLSNEGYKTAVCYGFDEAKNAIDEYFSINENGRNKNDRTNA